MKKRYLGLLFLSFLCTLNLAFANNECFTLQVSSETASVGDTVEVDIVVTGFDDIVGMQYTIEWNTNDLEFIGVTNTGLLGLSNYGPQQPETAGYMTVSWIDNSVMGVTLADGSVIYGVSFKVLSEGTTPIDFATGPTPPEFVVLPSETLSNFSLLGGQISTAGNPASIDEACVNITSCVSGSSTIISPTVGGGASPYTYVWSGPNNFVSTSTDLTGLSTSGTYSLTVTDSNGNETTGLFQVGLDGSFDVTASVNPDNCAPQNTGQIALNVQTPGTYTYQWSNSATTASISNLSAGTYTVTITETTEGCEHIETFEIIEQADVTVSSVVTDASCEGAPDGSINLTATASFPPATYTFAWSNGATTEDIDNLAPGFYSVTITDNNSCTYEETFVIGGGTALDITGTREHASCPGNNGSIDLHLPDPTVNYTFIWSNGATTEDLSGLDAGTYTVTVTNENGCTGTRSFSITDNGMIHGINYDCISPFNIIEINAILWAGGTAPFTFAWSTGDTIVTNSHLEPATISVAGEGTYGLTITDATGNCQVIDDNIEVECSNLNDVMLYLDSADDTLAIGDEYCLQVLVDGFVDIESFQFSLNWDPATLQFTSIGSFNVPNLNASNFGTTPDLTNNGQLSVSWNDPLGQANIVTLADGSSLFEVCFTVLSTADPVTVIEIAEIPTEIEFVNGNDDVLNVGTGIGLLEVEDATPTAGVEITGGQTSADPGVTVCIPIQVSDFAGLVGLQYSINWDTSQLHFVSVQDFNLPYLTISNFGISAENEEGILRFSWFDQSVSGITVADGTTIFEICFEVTGSSDIAYVNFTDTPILKEATTIQNTTVPVLTNSGVISISGTPVWPGDTDESEIVNHFDLLNIGLGYGQTGPARPNASLLWQEQVGAPWTYNTPNSTINAVHFDTDGNGSINQEDVLALEQNWGETTNFWDENDENRLPLLPELVTLNEAPILVEPQEVQTGQEATFNILLGDETILAEQVYGIAFTVVYDPEAVVYGSATATFTDSWLGLESSELITIFKDRPEDNRIDIALSRIDQVDRDGQGAIAQLSLTIEDVILRDENYQMIFQIENPRIISAQEALIPTTQPETISEVLTTTGTDNPDLQHRVLIYPVPVKDILHLQTDQLDVERIEVISLDGKTELHWAEAKTNIPTSTLAAGTYILQLYTDEGVIHKRFVKF